MTPLYQWAVRHSVPRPVLDDLLRVLGLGEPVASKTPVLSGQTEASVLQQRQLVAAKEGRRAWRNNSGVLEDKNGRPVRFGLGNTSAAINRVMKTSDLIGITPVVCGCGQRYGIFTAEEVKAPGWVFRESDERAVSQLNFLKIVTSLGGIAKFTTGE